MVITADAVFMLDSVHAFHGLLIVFESALLSLTAPPSLEEIPES